MMIVQVIRYYVAFSSLKRNCLFLCFALLWMNGWSQSATHVILQVNADDNNPVPGAFVRLLNTSYEGYTDEQGKLDIPRVTPGRYIIAITSAGFGSVTAVLTVKSGEMNTLRITLQQPTTQLPNVVVSSRKREEEMQALPLSVSALNAKAVDEYRLWKAKDLSGLVPNLYAANPGDGRNVISVRGITSTSYDPAVTTYIDGVSQFSLDTYIPQLFDVERIEILRGPQGTLYGRNAMGGVINIVTKEPSSKPDAFAEISYGNYATGRYTAGIRIPLVRNKLFLGATGLYEHTDGYYRNSFYQSSFDKHHSAGAGYTLKYLPAEKWKMTLNVKHLSTRNNGAFPLAASAADAFAEPFTVSQDAIARLVDNTMNASLSVQYFPGKWSLTSQTAYQSNYRYYRSAIDADFGPIDGITIINNYGPQWNNVKVLTQELRFNSNSLESRWKWTGGVFLFYQHAPVKQATHFGKDAVMVGSPDIDYAIVGTSKNRNSGLAGYLRSEYAITPDIQLSAGLRYDYQHTRTAVRGEYLPDGAFAPVFETRPDTAARANYDAISPSLSISWKTGKQHLVYASFNRGFRTGGLTQFSSDPSQPALFAYQPEYSNMIEVGSKNMLSGDRLRLNLALFYSRVSDAQVPTLVLPDAVTVIRNAGKLSSKGVETEIAFIPVKGLEVTGNLGYTHARYTSFVLSSGGQELDLKGNRQIFTPDVASSLILQYSFRLSRHPARNFVSRIEWLYTGTTYFDFANTIRQSPYHLLHARAGVAGRSVSLMGWVRNITDTKYISYAYDFGATHLGEPVMYGLTVKYILNTK